MIGGNRGAWIGVHDPNYNTNYSYSVGQKKNPARFVDIKGKACLIQTGKAHNLIILLKKMILIMDNKECHH